MISTQQIESTVHEPVNFDQRLESIRRDFENGETPQEIIDVLDRHIETLIATDAAKNVLNVGESVDANQTFRSDEKQLSLSELFGERFLVLSWFRGNW